MILTELPSPGIYSNSQKLRVETVKAISSCELVAPTDRADTLRDFFLAAAEKANEFAIEPVVITVAPAAPEGP